MKKYMVGLCYSGYVWHEVDAKNEREAYDKARMIADSARHGPVITDWERWPDADQIGEAV
jgi:hypothetical protein